VAKSAQCPAGKPWAVIKDSDGSVDGRCHPTKEAALAQLAALYASEAGASKMSTTGDCGCGQAADGPAHFQRASVDNSAWDGPAAMSGCTHSATPASCFGSICAGKKAGDTSTQAAWALPHHKSPGSPPNAAGVRNSLSRLPQTQGLTNKAQAQSHLEAHLSTIQAQSENAAQVAQLRRSAIVQNPALRLANGTARSQAFPAQLRGKPVVRNGREMYHVEGYASTFDQPYQMYDLFGPYDESMDPASFEKSLAREDLDTAFLTNHRGMTMARTKTRAGDDPTLLLGTDSHGFAAEAWLNLARQDVRDLASAIDDELITEMSFAFMLNAGEWSEDYESFRITEADVHRGDVSAVNYGANPYTSIAARAGEILAELEHLPMGAARVALTRLQARPDLAGEVAQARAAGDSLVGIHWQPHPEIALPPTVPGSEELGNGHGAFTGTHSHPHQAYGAQGGDDSHDHAHEHHGDGLHTHQHGKAAEAPQQQHRTERALTLALAEFDHENELDAELARSAGD
jgi:HK97 family phage prohead protease